jgi:hypothetical protein
LARAPWHQYQTDAAQVMAGLGCLVEIDAVVQGARALHRVDVAVRLQDWGISQTWLVECKHQKRRVTKSAVEALKSIVLDIGAEKAFLLSEAGFQPAAVAAAEKTSVSLSSLEELRAKLAPGLRTRLLSSLEKEALRLVPVLQRFQVEEPYGKYGTLYKGVPGVDFKNVTSARGTLHMLCSALQAAKIGEYGYVISRSFPKGQNAFIRLPDPQSLLSEGTRLVAEVTAWVQGQEFRVARAANRRRSKARAEI